MHLKWNTVSQSLKEILIELMNEPLFNPFLLVGGTGLSLQIGHRKSIDIDLFTDNEYGSIDFEMIDRFLKSKYPYFDKNSGNIIGQGCSYFIGKNEKDSIKLDLYYTDNFVYKSHIVEHQIRICDINEIIAMKIDVLYRGGRMKDFWDLHYFLDLYSLKEFEAIYNKRYFYVDCENLRNKWIDFKDADDDFVPNCLLGKKWDVIKYDFIEKLKKSANV
jgi:predicted nucleotidyltransferase component of viral defense system